MNYFKKLGFYFLTIVDGIINFLCSIFGVYLGVDSSTNFLLFLEMRRVRSVVDERAKGRLDLSDKAAKKFEEAKDTLDG